MPRMSPRDADGSAARAGCMKKDTQIAALLVQAAQRRTEAHQDRGGRTGDQDTPTGHGVRGAAAASAQSRKSPLRVGSELTGTCPALAGLRHALASEAHGH